MNFIKNNHRILFITCWLLINLWQAATTELLDDEAYYWVYAQFPAWGYFDHPPMIAWLIRAGSFLFNGEFGLRFFIVVFNTATILVIGQLLRKKDPWLFYAICGSIAVVQIGGIIAVPDLPLLFFIALYFLFFQHFMDHMSVGRSVLLGVSISLMMYSKYHGILLVIFTLLAQPKLLLRCQTYIAAVIAIALFIPHINWQLAHDLPSVQYHLFERNANAYRISFTTEYILGQLLLAGPLVGWLFMYCAARYRPETPTEKAMKWSMAGIYIFFLISSLKGRVEANWTIPAFVSLIVLSHQFLVDQARQRRWIYRSLPLSLMVVLAVRLFFAADLRRSEKLSKDEVHGNRDWLKSITDRAGEENVVVLNSYQTPSKYYFYTGKPALGLNTAEYRRNNYNFWPIERQFIGKPAFVMGIWDSVYLANRFTNHYLEASGSVHIPYYYSLAAIQFKKVKAIDSPGGITLEFIADIPEDYLPLLKTAPIDTAQVYISVIRDELPVEQIATGLRVNNFTSDRQDVTVTVNRHITSEYLALKLSVSTVLPGRLSVNSTGFKIQ